MGIRSDVIFCIKNEAYKSLSDKTKKTINDWFGGYKERNGEGMLFYTESVKWYHDCNNELRDLYQDLSALDEAFDESYLVLAACSEYPADNGADIGEWYDNPWGTYKSTTVTVHWDGC